MLSDQMIHDTPIRNVDYAKDIENFRIDQNSIKFSSFKFHSIQFNPKILF